MRVVRTDNPYTCSFLAESIRQWGFFDRSRHWWWIVYEGDEWVAYAAMCLFDRETMYLGPSFVKPSVRGNGLQRLLLRHREAFALAQGIWCLVTAADHHNHHSMRNILAEGFVECDSWCGSVAKCFLKNLMPAGDFGCSI